MTVLTDVLVIISLTLYWMLPAHANSSCGLKRAQEVYTGCGYTYILKRERDVQCGSGGTSKLIVDTYNNGSSCGLERSQVVYTGCGYTYLSQEDRNRQCGTGGTSKIIFDSWETPEKSSLETPSSKRSTAVGECSISKQRIQFVQPNMLPPLQQQHLDSICTAYSHWLMAQNAESLDKTSVQYLKGRRSTEFGRSMEYLRTLTVSNISLVE